MRAYQIDKFGSVEDVALHERADPVPGPGETLVRVHARCLNYRDLMILDQRYKVPAMLGVIPLSDGAGEVVDVGAGVTRFSVGDRVLGTYFPRWIDGRFALAMAMEQFGCTRDGMLGELVLADEQALVAVPPHLSFEQASALPCAGVTAWSALTGMRRLIPGETVLTIGTGGVALFAIQFAKLFGARVVAVTARIEKADRLTALGADHVVDSSADGDWAGAVRDATGGRGVDYVVETGGLTSLPGSLASCAPEAQVALVAAPGDGTVSALSLGAPVTIRRFYVGSRAGFETMNIAIAHHRLIP